MAVVGVADQYMILMSLTLLFTVLAIAWSSKILLTLLASITWFFSALVHHAIGDPTSPLSYTASLLFLALGIVFAAKTGVTASEMLNERRSRSVTL